MKKYWYFFLISTLNVIMLIPRVLNLKKFQSNVLVHSTLCSTWYMLNDNALKK